MRTRTCSEPESSQSAHGADAAVALELPPYAGKAIDALEAAGHESWVVGGCVRDALLGRGSTDVDIATRAPWREAQRAFEALGWRTHETGTAHGTLTVVIDGRPVEVTTFRADGAYEDARHPKRVSFVRTIE